MNSTSKWPCQTHIDVFFDEAYPIDEASSVSLSDTIPPHHPTIPTNQDVEVASSSPTTVPTFSGALCVQPPSAALPSLSTKKGKIKIYLPMHNKSNHQVDS